ncbi:MAG TPA: hypothetical protein VLL75_02915, partial [Vicinamibacteria bacterium]|nr:hypothetical protein [Vicinamibacteria bacterium]
MVRATVGGLVLGLALAGPIEAKVVVFQEAGFPSIESEAPSRETLAEALQGKDVTYVGVEELQKPEALSAGDLLVLPYGSAFPADAWPAIRSHLESGGNLLNLGGRPLWFPVFREAVTPAGSEAPEPAAAAPARFRIGRPQGTYWRLLAAVQAAEVPARAFGR